MQLPPANEAHFVMELSRIGGPLVGVGGLVGAVIGYFNPTDGSPSESLRAGAVIGAIAGLGVFLFAVYG